MPTNIMISRRRHAFSVKKQNCVVLFDSMTQTAVAEPVLSL
jgi:hypothetical protein